mgnify:CR=1 FL=1
MKYKGGKDIQHFLYGSSLTANHPNFNPRRNTPASRIWSELGELYPNKGFLNQYLNNIKSELDVNSSLRRTILMGKNIQILNNVKITQSKKIPKFVDKPTSNPKSVPSKTKFPSPRLD